MKTALSRLRAAMRPRKPKPNPADEEIAEMLMDNPGLTTQECGEALYKARAAKGWHNSKDQGRLAAAEALTRLYEDGRVFRNDGKWWPVVEL